MEQEKQPGYYMVIPATVWNDEQLTANAKLLYGHISTLSHKSGECWASNEYFAKVLDIEERSIRRLIDLLEERNHISKKLISIEENNSQRILTICNLVSSPRADVRVQKGTDVRVLHNKTSNNKTRENISPRKKTYDPFLEQAINESKLDALTRWNRITSLWQTSEPESTLKSTFNKYFVGLDKEVQMSIVGMIEEFGSDVQYLSNVWISTTFRTKCMNGQSLRKDIEKIKKHSRPIKKDDKLAEDIKSISSFKKTL